MVEEALIVLCLVKEVSLLSIQYLEYGQHTVVSKYIARREVSNGEE